MDDGAVRIGQHLDLDVPRVLEVALDIDRRIGEVGLALSAGGLEGTLDLVRRANDLEALPASARRGLDRDRPAELFPKLANVLGSRDRLRRPGDDGNAGRLHPLAGGDLRPHDVDRLGRWADPGEPGVLDGAGEGCILGEESVTGMDCLGAGALRCVDHSLLDEVALRGWSRPEQVRLVGGTHVQRVAIRLRVDGDGRDPELPQRAEDPNRNLATVGDEHLREAGHDGHIVSLWGRPISSRSHAWRQRP